MKFQKDNFTFPNQISGVRENIIPESPVIHSKCRYEQETDYLSTIGLYSVNSKNKNAAEMKGTGTNPKGEKHFTNVAN